MPRSRTQKAERKHETKRKGSVTWKRGEPHHLDVFGKELTETRAELPGLLEALLSTAQRTVLRLSAIVETAREDALADAFALADQEARSLALERFGNRKHLDHLLTVFALQRQKRLHGRLRTIAAALTLANELLAEEETLSQEFLTAWQTSRHTPAAPDDVAPEPETVLLLPEEEPASEPLPPPPTREQLRVMGLGEPLKNIVSSADHARQLLRDFEARLPDLRRQLSTGQGWFEVFYVPKRHYKQEVIAYFSALTSFRDHNAPIPLNIIAAIHPEVARIIEAGGATFPKKLREHVYDITSVGPYAKYRWTENKQTYTISLGLLDDYPPFPFVPEGF